LDHLTQVASEPESPLFHQYARSLGHLELVNPLKDMYSKRLGRELTVNEILVTNGVTQGLYIACQAFLDVDDEMITFEPFFDLHTNDAFLASANVRLVPLHADSNRADNWRYSEDDVRAAVTPKSKAILINTPQNVPGKVWSREELESIAKVAIEHDLLVLADEVYGELVYDGLEHVSIASLPGMYERTITFSSAGKTFSCTGWKVGWAVAPPALIASMQQVQSMQTFSIATPLQIAVGRSLRACESNGYLEELKRTFMRRRQLLCDTLRNVGLPPVVPSGGYFALADISRVDPRHFYNPDDTVAKDWQFCRWLTKVIGVNAIPVSAFCSEDHKHRYENYVRFAYCKAEADITEAGRRMEKLKLYFKP
jgi:aspartate/methionine/tyrosine aminotransferase